MMKTLVHEARCLCGALRLSTSATPIRIMACHCSTCKRRTGSAFGVGVYFREEEVRIEGRPRQYEFKSTTTDRWIRTDYCTDCGTTVSWTLEMRPGVRAVAAGCFDDPNWYRITHHIWTKGACDGMAYPADVEVHDEALPT